jgi:hypothetical protein
MHSYFVRLLDGIGDELITHALTPSTTEQSSLALRWLYC